MTETPVAKRYQNSHPLTDKQKAFLKHYTQGLNPKEAAIQAGYNPRDAHKRAHEILKKPEFKKFVANGLKRLSKTQENEIDNDLRKTLSTVEDIIINGTTPEKLERLATPSHALAAIDIKAKIKSFYAPEKSINVNVDIEVARTQRLTESIKEKERGF